MERVPILWDPGGVETGLDEENEFRMINLSYRKGELDEEARAEEKAQPACDLDTLAAQRRDFDTSRKLPTPMDGAWDLKPQNPTRWDTPARGRTSHTGC